MTTTRCQQERAAQDVSKSFTLMAAYVSLDAALWKDLRLTACFFLGFCFILLFFFSRKRDEPRNPRTSREGSRERSSYKLAGRSVMPATVRPSRPRGLIFLMKMKGVNGSFLSFYRRLSPLVIFFQGKLEPGDGIKNEISQLPALRTPQHRVYPLPHFQPCNSS